MRQTKFTATAAAVTHGMLLANDFISGASIIHVWNIRHMQALHYANVSLQYIWFMQYDSNCMIYRIQPPMTNPDCDTKTNQYQQKCHDALSLVI